MSPVLTGSIVCMAAIIGYLFSFRCYLQHNLKHAVLLLLLCSILLRVYVSSDSYLHEWDERFHALVAKSMLADPLTPKLYDRPLLPYDYKNWLRNEVWLHKQPLPLWLMAGTFHLTGVNEWGVRLPSIVATSLLVLITFLIGRRLAGNRAGFIAAFLCSFNGLIVETTGGRAATDHYDVMFLFFVSWAIWLAIKFADTKKVYLNILCGVVVGAAVLCRWLPGLIVLPVWLIAVQNSRRFTFKEVILSGMQLMLTICVIVLPWQVYIHRAFPLESEWESRYNFLHFTEVLEGHGGPWYFHLEKLSIAFGDIMLLPVLWFTFKTIRRRSASRLILMCWLWVPLIFFSLAATKMTGYTLFTAPAVFIILGFAAEVLLRRRRYRSMRFIAPVLLTAFLLLSIRYAIERIKFFDGNNRNPRWVQQLRNLDKEFPEKNTVFFGMNRPIETMFYTNGVAYQEIPSDEVLQQIMKQGYRIVINSDGLSDSISTYTYIAADALSGPVQED